MSAKALAQDMYIEELERNLSDAARMMLDDGCHGDKPQQLTAWLNATAERSSYEHIHRNYIQVVQRIPSYTSIGVAKGCMGYRCTPPRTTKNIFVGIFC